MQPHFYLSTTSWSAHGRLSLCVSLYLEDVAIAYGYNNIKRTIPPLTTVGAQQPLNHFSDLVRQEVAMQGFSEMLTWILCSHDDNFANVSREDTGKSAAIVANPSSLDVQVVRSSLLPGVLKAMGANKDAPLPAKLFEVGDVVLLDEEKDVGARNSRRLLVLYTNVKVRREGGGGGI